MTQKIYCYGCMREKQKESNFCPYCGFNYKDYIENANENALLPGTILNGKYLLGKVLGAGGFGITYLGYDIQLQRKVAIKEYFPTNNATRKMTEEDGRLITVRPTQNRTAFETGLKNFQDEARILGSMSRREKIGIVEVTEFFHENGTGYIVMEYLPGPTLKELVKQKKIRPDQMEFIGKIRPVLHSLEMIHGHGLLHRDISPDNIMLDDEGKLILIDFGASRSVASDKSLTVILKQGFAPIEQYATDGNQGPWTDIYAMCATFYYVFSGKVPQGSADRLIDDQLQPLSTVNPNVSQAFSDVIMRGMALKPENRYQSMADLNRALERAVLGTGAAQDSGNAGQTFQAPLGGDETIPLNNSQKSKYGPEDYDDQGPGQREVFGGPVSGQRDIYNGQGPRQDQTDIYRGPISRHRRSEHQKDGPDIYKIAAIGITGLCCILLVILAVYLLGRKTTPPEPTELTKETTTVSTDDDVGSDGTEVEEPATAATAKPEDKTVTADVPDGSQMTYMTKKYAAEYTIRFYKDAEGDKEVNYSASSAETGGWLPEGVFVARLDKKGSRFKVYYGGLVGWVESKHLVRYSEGAYYLYDDNYSGENVFQSHKGNGIKVHTKASADSPYALNGERIDYGRELEVLGIKNGFAKIKYHGKKVFIDMHYIRTYAGDNSHWKVEMCGKSSHIAVRKTWDEDSLKIGKIRDGKSITIQEFRNGWGKVKVDGKKGWVMLYYCLPKED